MQTSKSIIEVVGVKEREFDGKKFREVEIILRDDDGVRAGGMTIWDEKLIVNLGHFVAELRPWIDYKRKFSYRVVALNPCKPDGSSMLPSLGK